MKYQSNSLFVLAAASLIAASSFAGPAKETAATTEVALSFRTLRTWDVRLPAEAFAPIGKTIPFAAAGEAGLKIAIEEGTLRIDRNGDGELDGRVETPDKEKGSQLVVFRLNEGSANESTYAIRVKNEGRWSYAPAGAMEGQAGNTRFMIFDQNGNGRFDDYGVDAMIVGRGKTASFLSHSIHIDGVLNELVIGADGRTAALTPFSGETGKLDLGTELTTKAKMRSVIVNSEDGKHSFELSRALTAKGGLNVPAGSYVLHSAQVVLGKSHAEMTVGNSKPITVAAGETSTLSWGGPVNAKFGYKRGGDKLQIAPGDIKYYGSAGEVYANFMPLGSSPKFAIKEKATGKVLVNTVFPGNC